MPVLGPMPQGDAHYYLGANDVEVEAAIDVFFPLRASAAASPEVEIALLVAVQSAPITPSGSAAPKTPPQGWIGPRR